MNKETHLPVSTYELSDFGEIITQDLSSWQGGSGVCRPCVCGTWAWFAGVQLQQPGIQPEELEGVGDDDVASDS